MIDVGMYVMLRKELQVQFGKFLKKGTEIEATMRSRTIRIPDKLVDILVLFEADLVFFKNPVKLKVFVQSLGALISSVISVQLTDGEEVFWSVNSGVRDLEFIGKSHTILPAAINHFRTLRLEKKPKSKKLLLTFGGESMEVDPALFPEIKEDKIEELAFTLKKKESHSYHFGDTGFIPREDPDSFENKAELPKKKSTRSASKSKIKTHTTQMSEFLEA